MASTKDCLDYIERNHEKFSLPVSAKWKRLKKYKNSIYDIREFIFKDTEKNQIILVVISESTAGQLEIIKVLYDKQVDNFNGKVDLIFDNSSDIKKTMNRSLHSFEQNNSFAYLIRNMNILINKSHYSSNKIEDLTDEIIQKELNKAIKKSDEFLIDVESITYDYIEAVMEDIYCYCYDDDEDYSDKKEEQLFRAKFGGIVASTENVFGERHSFKEAPNFEFIYASMGGDWEIPINFFIYVDPENNKEVKIYVPLDKGNTYIKSAMCAAGSLANYVENPTEKELELEIKMMEAEEGDTNSKLEAQAFKSFKKHLTK